MNNLLNLISIKVKLSLIIIIALLAVVINLVFDLNQSWDNLHDSKLAEVKNITEVAFSILEEQNRLVSENKITKAQGIENAKEAIRSLRYGNNNYFFMFNDRYYMVVQPVKPSLEKSSQMNLTDSAGKLFFKDLVDQSKSKGSATVEYLWPKLGSSEPINKISYGKYLSALNLGVATGLYTDDINDIYWNEVKSGIISTVILLSLLTSVVLIVARSITKPLSQLEQKIVEVAENKDLTIRTALQGKDELTDISQSFDSMLEAFDSTIKEMHSAAEQVATTSTELSVTTDQTLVGMENQKAETHQVATAVAQMSATVHDVATNTAQAAAASDGAAQASDDGKIVIKTAKDSVNKLATSLTQAEDITHTLEEQTENITSILSVITSIADQTNLLALNAAIEAARAGEHGRGFAVVADEVRSLSSRTHESTDEIHRVISELQSGTAAVVQAMKESRIAADEVDLQSYETSGALIKITEAVEQIDSMTSQIATASEQQSTVAEEISRNVDAITLVTDESVVGAQQISASSSELAELANGMKDNVLQFRFSA